MARKRLNTNLLIALTAAIAVAALGLFLGVNYYLDNPDRAVSRATAFEAEGEFRKAAGQWGRAYRSTRDSDYGLKVVENLGRLTVDPEAGDQNLEQMGQILGQLVTDNPDDADVQRRLIRHYSTAPGFLTRRVTGPTRFVREAAERLLEIDPTDSEAIVYFHATSLDLANVPSEGITEDEIEEARAALAGVIRNQPVNGAALSSLRVDLSRRLSGLTADEVIDEILIEAESLTEAAVASVEADFTPREGEPTDAAEVLIAAGQMYDALGGLRDRQAQLAIAQAARDAGDVPDPVIAREAGRAASQAPREQAVAQFRAAVDRLLEGDSVNSTSYVRAHFSLVEALRRQNELDEAEAVLDRVAEARPWDVRAINVYADLLRDRGKFQEAREILQAVAAKADEPLPELFGFAGATARLQRAYVGLYLADAAMDERRSKRQANNSSASEQRELLEIAERGFSDYSEKADLLSLNRSFAVDKIEGLLQIARGDTFAGMDTLESGLRDLEQIDSPFTRTEQVTLLRLLADVNREAGQAGSETEYLARAFNLQGNVNDGIRLMELYRLSGELGRARDILTRLEPIKPSLTPDLVARLEAAEVLLTPQEDRAAAVAQLPESTDRERRIKIDAALRANETDTAVRLTEQVFAEAPEDERIAQVLAQLYLRTNQREAALEVVRQFPDNELFKALEVALTPGSADVLDTIEDPAQRKLYEAQVAERDGQPQEAIALAEEARTLVADDATTEQRNAIDEAVFDLLLRNDATVKATAVAEDLGRRGADGAGGDLYRVRIQVAEGDLDEATRQVKALANRFPRMAEAQMALSEVLRRVGDNAGAADAARQALSLAPTDVRAIIEAATAFEAAGRADDAQSVIQQGLVQRPRDPRLRQLDETLTLRYGDAEPVLADRRRAVEENPEDATAWQRLAAAQAAAVENAVRGDDAALRAERVRATVDTALQGLEKFPDDGRFLAQLARVGRLAEDEGIQDRVREAVQRVMTPSFEETLIDDASAVGAAATYYANVDDLQSAIIVVRRHLGRLSADAPREQRAFMLLALSQLLTRGGQNEEAASVLVGFEDVPQVQQRLVAMLAQQATQATGEEQDRLFERLADAVSGDDVQPGPLLAAAFAELNRGNAERAVELLERADRIRPDDGGTIYLLGVALGQLNPPDLEGARDQLERAAELRPTNLDAYRNLARVYQQLGERDAAEDAYLRLLEVDDADLNARLALIQMQLAKSPPDYAAADRYFRAAEATAVAGSPTLLIARARMEMDRNRATDAVTYGRRSVEASVDARRALAGNASPTAQELRAANIPNFLNAYLDLLLRSGRISEAIREIDFWSSRVTANGAEEPHWLQVRRAEAFARDGRRTEARDAYIRAFNTAAATDPGQADVVLLEMAKRIDPDSAYALVRDRVEGDQSDAQATMSAAMIAARIYIQANENDRALGFIRKVRQVFADEGQEIRDSTEILLSQQEGTLYLTNTPPQLDDAASAFRRALELAPDNVAVNNNLAYTLTLLADASEESDMGKERLLRQAVERGDVALATARNEARRRGGVASPSVIDTVGWARAKLAMTTGDDAGLDEAIRLLRTARDNAERDGNAFPEVYVHLARALRADGNLSDAIESARVGLDFVTRRLDNAEERRPGDEQLLNEVRDLIREMENEADAAAAQEGVE